MNIKMPHFILMIATVASTLIAKATPIEIDGSVFFFHWGSSGRIETLLNFKNLNKKAFSYAGSGVNGMTLHSKGFYVSEDIAKWTNLGEQLCVIQAPNNYLSDSSLVPFSNYKNVDYRIIKNNDQIRIIPLHQFLQVVLNRHQSHNPFLETDSEIEKLLQIILKTNDSKSLSVLNNYYLNSDDNDALKIALKNHLPAFAKTFKDYTSLSSRQKRFIKKEDPKYAFSNLYSLLQLRRLMSSTDYMRLLGLTATTDEDINNQQIRSFLQNFEKMSEVQQGSTFEKMNLYLYGKDTVHAWVSALSSQSMDELPTVDSIKNFHKSVYPESVGEFKSFLLNAISKISAQGKRSSLMTLFHEKKWNELKKQLNTTDPRGVFRDGAIYIDRNSESSDSQGQLFTENQIQRLQQNPFIKVEVVNKTNDGLQARIIIPENSQIENIVEQALSRVRQQSEQLISSKVSDENYFKQAVRIASDFYYDLTSYHIFWDGSGRTLRAQRDQILEWLGLPPAAYTPDRDWELSREEMYERTLIAVRDSSETFKFRFTQIAFTRGQMIQKNQNDHSVKSCQKLFN